MGERIHERLNVTVKLEKVLLAIQIAEGWRRDETAIKGKLKDAIPEESPFRKLAEAVEALVEQSKAVLERYPLLEVIGSDTFYNWYGTARTERTGDEPVVDNQIDYFGPRRDKVTEYIALVDRYHKLQEVLRVNDQTSEKTTSEVANG